MTITKIAEFKDYCLNKGFNYSDELIRRFVISLETKPFLLLSGISGSGKTKIAELWKEYLKDKEGAESILISVGSNWQTSKPLLGFLNPLLDDSEAYQSTQLVDLIKKSQDKEVIIIFDEMNLSQVEIYFAEFLSALETLDHKITLPDGSCIAWTNNIKIIGTVNVDESTRSFSPKVLDRANVIEMNGEAPSSYIEAVANNENKIYKSIQNETWFSEYIDILDKVYYAMNCRFAYRVVDEITSYVATSVRLFGEEKLMSYIDEQMIQKVMTRIHGDRHSLKPILTELEKIFADKDCPMVKKKISQLQINSKKGFASSIGE